MRKFSYIFSEIFLRAILVAGMMYLEYQTGTQRDILPEEWHRFKHTEGKQLLENKMFVASGCLISVMVIMVSYTINKDQRDFINALLGISMSICMTAFLTDLIKMTVPKPRPSFFVYCFPDGRAQNKCTGDSNLVDAGQKSFPSGHTSFAFASMSFLFLYLSAKLNLFNKNGKGESWRLCLCMSPIILAIMVGIFRTTKNMHHPEDVLAGGIIGSIIAYLCYRHRYPSVFELNSGNPYEFLDDDGDPPDS